VKLEVEPPAMVAAAGLLVTVAAPAGEMVTAPGITRAAAWPVLPTESVTVNDWPRVTAAGAASETAPSAAGCSTGTGPALEGPRVRL
jgi:hypothetical protein